MMNRKREMIIEVRLREEMGQKTEMRTAKLPGKAQRARY